MEEEEEENAKNVESSPFVMEEEEENAKNELQVLLTINELCW